jgi:hypothetical protein
MLTYMNTKQTPPRVKQAADEHEAPFEQAFANLAYGYLKDKAPRLLDFVIGFQLVDRNEDNTKAVGVFGFKIGKQWLYAPVFFLNGDLKGHELLYMKDADQFVPMRENWVNYLMSRKPNMLGEASSESSNDLGVMTPHLEYLSSPPGRYSKWGSAKQPAIPPKIRDWAKNAIALMSQWQSRSEHNPLSKRASAIDLPGFLSENLGALTLMERWYREYPTIKIGVDRFHGGKDLFAKAAQKLRDRLLQSTSASSLLQPWSVKESKAPTTFDLLSGPQSIPLRKLSVEVITSEDGPFLERRLTTDEDREKLLNNALLIEDNRSGDEVDVAYQVQEPFKLQSPTETTVTEVLVKPGKFRKSLVIAHPYSSCGRNSFVTVITTDGEDKEYANADMGAVWAKPDDETNHEFTQEYIDSLPDVGNSLERDTWYVIVAKNGMGTCPFRVEEDKGDGKYRVDFRDSKHRSDLRQELPKSDFAGRVGMQEGRKEEKYDGSPYPYDGMPYSFDDGPCICINARKGAGFYVNRNELMVPEDAKLIRLKKSKIVRKENGDIDWDKTPSEAHDSPKILVPGSLIDLEGEIMAKTSALQVWSNGPDFYVVDGSGKRGRFSKVAAIKHLVIDRNLDEDQAQVIVKVAETNPNPQKYRIKKAFPGAGGNLTDTQNSYNVNFLPPGYHTDSSSGGIPATGPQEQFETIPDLHASMTDPEVYNQKAIPDPMAMQDAQRAAGEGQKEVFDTAMLGSMLKVVREDSMVERHLPDMMRALDRIGRILFLFYWHGEEFEDRYGKQDMPELEDTLRNAFETIGDLTLFLKQKTVEPFGEGGSQMGEPTLDDSARN